MWLPMFCCLGNQEADDDLNSDDEEAEGVGSNPIVRTYLIPNEHGSCRRYWAEFVLVVGLVLPWMGPIGSLCVASPFIKLGVQQSQVAGKIAWEIHSTGLIPEVSAGVLNTNVDLGHHTGYRLLRFCVCGVRCRILF